jgi:tRNA (guanine10-N2)-dimethyltransferase
LFFVLSGEHHSLPAAEVKAIIESEQLPFSSPVESYRLLTLTASRKALKLVSERSLMYERCGELLGECVTDQREIERFVKNQPLEELTKGANNFAVRSARIGIAKAIGRVNLERDVGAVVKESVPRLNVKLKEPDLTFVCILDGSRFLFGLSGYKKPSGLMAPRRPRKRPVFHPSTMPPKIARCMVNLARATPGALLADPFCGVGGILIEASVVGCRVVGMDASMRALRGARRNVRYFNLNHEGFLKGDARHLPLHEIGAIATDPPYGRDSSTMGAGVRGLARGFLSGAKDSLKKGAHICISAPKEVELETYAKDAGFIMRERHYVRIHRSLTRQFVVLQN